MQSCSPCSHSWGGKSYAHNIGVANADGVTIYYNYINDKTELEVTYQGTSPISNYTGNVVIPESVTYDGNTYSVTTIGNCAFWNCSGLTKVTIPNSVISIDNYAFYGCRGLTELTIPGSVTSIGDYAFSGCSSLTKVTIPNSVISIGKWAFYDCRGLTELTIGNSVTSIGDDAFYYCSSLKEVTIPNSVTSIGNYAFFYCNSLTEVTIGSSVTSIGNYAFFYCSSLTELTIPGSVTSIGDGAFWNCSGLTELTIPGSVTSIGNSAFYNCSSLTELTIPGSVTSIGEWAFAYCWNLTTLYSLNTTPPSVANTSTFNSDHYTTVDLFVPEDALEAYQTADVWKDFQKLQAIGGGTAVEEISATVEQIQAANGQITVTGLTDGTTVTVYDLSGKQVGTATSTGGQVNISTRMTAGAVAIVKMGDKSVKVAVK